MLARNLTPLADICTQRLMVFVALMTILLCGAASAETRVSPGDKIQLLVYNHPDLSSTLIVTSAGDIRVPLVGAISVDGLSEAEAATHIEEALSKYFYHPEVAVTIATQGQSVFFTGSIVGVQMFEPGETLGTAVASLQTASEKSSGSSTNGTALSSTDLRQVRIERHRVLLPPIDLETLSRSGESGPRLEPGDVVHLRAKPVRVDIRGHVSSPTTVYVYRGDTLAQALSQAGPLPPDTSLSKIVLLRDNETSFVTAAGKEFIGPARDGDIITMQPAPQISVFGMVEKAGDITLQATPTLLNALYAAGGPNRYADLKHIQVTDKGRTTVYDISRLTHGDLAQNVAIDDGDVVFVPEGHKIDLTSFANALGALASFRVISGQ